jgi:Uma2 family endonuclease
MSTDDIPLADSLDWGDQPAERPPEPSPQPEPTRENAGAALPGERHCLICGNVAWVLNNYARQQRTGYVLSNSPRIVLEREPGANYTVDVALFTDRKGYAELSPSAVEGVPLLAVVILAPGERIGKVTRRITAFLRAGVRLVWVIDPEARDVTAHSYNGSPSVVEEDDNLTSEDILPDFSCSIREFFRVPGET